MPDTPEALHRSIRRRAFLALAAAGLALPFGTHLAAARDKLVRTPAQTEGPFYPREWTGDIDADLVTVTGQPGRAKGDILHVRGRVLRASDGAPIAGATVELWQVDANGIYLHPEDEGPSRVRDRAFQGRGRTISDAEGRYAFRTIRPPAYEGRPPHIHFRVVHPGHRTLTTQMYEAGNPLNDRDGVMRAVRRSGTADRLMASLAAADEIEPGARLAAFDIVL